MAELRCADGTVVQISAGTEKELRKAFGKPERTYTIGDVFWWDEPSCIGGEHYFRLVLDCEDDSRVGLRCVASGTGFCSGTHVVGDITKITHAEVGSMTYRSDGLRVVKMFTITEEV